MKYHRSCAIALCVLGSAVLLQAADAKPEPTPDQIQDIIKKFTQKETEFAIARENYTYRQTTKLQETDPPGGAWEIVEDVSFDDRNKRTSHVTYAPVVSLEHIILTPEDEQDVRHVMPFVMTNDTLSEYDVSYVGRQQVDEISCYVFNVKPKVLTKDRKRYFDGQIWVDDQDLQIVKTYGRSTGHLNRGEDQQFPKFETYRQQIDGKYWFPVYTYADDTLHFKDGQDQRVKEIIKYDHYKKWEFKTNSTITYGGTVDTTTGAPANPPAGASQPSKPPEQ
ncbi:MAG: hypothetical protein JO138_23075 [Acidobacteriaceae bacterium]|nr:hypothetical protein [Acidobacteriaceae bacterium]